MKKVLTSLLFLGLVLSQHWASAQKNPEEKLGWKLGAQAYTFRLFTFDEALRKIDSCGLKYVEAYPGQTIGGGVEGKMEFTMDAAKRQAVKKLLKDRKLTLSAFGVVSPKTQAEWEQLFEFAK